MRVAARLPIETAKSIGPNKWAFDRLIYFLEKELGATWEDNAYVNAVLRQP